MRSVYLATAVCGVLFALPRDVQAELPWARTAAQTHQVQPIFRLPQRPDPLPASVTLEELQSAAFASRPALAAPAARVRAAQGRAFQAGLMPNPTIGYTADEIGAEGTAGMHGMFVEQQFVRGGKLDLRRLAAAKAVTREELLAEAERMKVSNGVRMRFYRVLAARRLLQLRKNLLITAQDAQKTAEQLKNNGKINRQEELLAVIEARQAEFNVQTAKTASEAAWRDLAAFVGRPNMPPAPLEGELEELRDPIERTASLSFVLTASPTLAAAHAEIARRDAALRREIAEPTPDVAVRIGAQYSYETRDPVALVEVGVPLPLFNRNQGNISAARAQLAEAQAGASEMELSLIRGHAAAFARYEQARAAAESYRRQINDATEMYGLYQEAFNLRRVSYQEVLVAQRTFFRLHVDYVQALADLHQAEAVLEGLLMVDGEEKRGDYQP